MKKIDFLFGVVVLTLFILAVYGGIKSIDRITLRDCERGVKSACFYLHQ